LKSLLIVIKDEFLSKGIALGLLDYFQSIHTTKNPFEAIEIVKNESIDIIISNVNFSTLEPGKYISSITQFAKTTKRIIIIKDAPFNLEEINSRREIIIKEKSISLKSIIKIIKSVEQNKTKLGKGREK